MLVEMAIADAYGAGFEYTKPSFMATNHTMDGYVQHPTHLTLLPGQYTDDTQMALALAELMLREGKNGKPHHPTTWTPIQVAHAFVSTFTRDKRDGYARGFQKVLEDCSESDVGVMAAHFLATIRPHSEKNGAAMRAGPIGLLPNTDHVINVAMFQASLTHATRIGMSAAAASALMVHYFHHRLGPKGHLGFYLDNLVPGYQWGAGWSATVNAYGFSAVRAAVAAILESDTLSEVLKRCVDFGGDTDTTAAIAVCAASRCEEIAQFLPSQLVNDLEDSAYGHEYLSEIDAQLFDAYPSPEAGDLEKGGDFDNDLDDLLDALT